MNIRTLDGAQNNETMQLTKTRNYGIVLIKLVKYDINLREFKS